MHPLVVSVLAISLAAISPADVERAVTEIREQPSYQTTLPGGGPTVAQTPPISVEEPSGGTQWEASETLSGIARALMWSGVVVVVVLVLVWVFSQIEGRRRDPTVAAQSEAVSRASPLAERPTSTDDPERLAGEGRFEEAIHLLLLRAIERLHREFALSDAWTSREILYRLSPSSAVRGPLAVLVQVAERAHFGGWAVGRPEFERCVAHYDEFVRTSERGRP